MRASILVTGILFLGLISISGSTEGVAEAGIDQDEFEDYELDDLDIDEATREKQQWERILKDQRDSGVQVEVMEESKECSK